MIVPVSELSVDSADPWWNRVSVRKTRVIPALLLHGRGFVKTVRFRKPAYLGDPVNIVRIFNEKEVDEIVILDILATRQNRGPNFELLADIAGECFMPLAYGGGVRTVEDFRRLTSLGFEKVCVNTSAMEDPELVRAAAERFGRSTVIVSIDVKERLLGKYTVHVRGGERRTGIHPIEAAQRAEENGAGELLVNSINRDGTMRGYDLKLVRQLADAVSIPVVACGGAATVQDLRDAVAIGRASAVAAGSMFVFHGPHRAVLINMPTAGELEQAGVP